MYPLNEVIGISVIALLLGWSLSMVVQTYIGLAVAKRSIRKAAESSTWVAQWKASQNAKADVSTEDMQAIVKEGE